jgi:Ca2+-binding RTX toxin-like protein
MPPFTGHVLAMAHAGRQGGIVKLSLSALAGLAALVAILGLLDSGAQVTYAGDDDCIVSDGVTHSGNTITGTRKADTIDCRGASSGHIISGGGGGDIIYGSDHIDIISGGAKNDTIYGEGGDDTLCGGVCDSPAASSITSGADGDGILYVGAYDATSPAKFAALGSFAFTKGGSGNDIIFGGAGNDTIIGGSGDDELYGDGGDDFISGGNHDDVLYGGDGVDELYGGHHNDTLNGEDGEVCVGGSGNDTINCP